MKIIEARILSPTTKRIAVVKKFEKKIQEQAAIKKEESDKVFHGNQYVVVSSPNGEQTKQKICTDKELAKLANVGTGTIARFNRGLLLLKSIDRYMKDRLKRIKN